MADPSASSSSSSSSTITVAAEARPKATKLRQTCDPCSEAKVKCDKGNPRCGRCDRLSYDCVYSPARRIGRPRPRSRRSPEQDDGGRPASNDRDAGSSTTTRETVKKDYPAPAPAPAPAPTPRAPERPAQQQINVDETLPDYLSDEGRWSAAASGSSTTSNERTSGRSSVVRNDDVASNRDGLLGGGGSLDMNPPLGPEEVRHDDPYEYDCATVAVATLGELAAAGGGLNGPQSAAAAAAAAAEVLADQIPHACRQAARILVCPCSTDMDTALLVASLAAAILDVADAALRTTLKPAGHALDDEQHTVLALGTIPGISRVVTLFTHRYSVTQSGRPPEALLLLAASLRTTLKTMAEKTTNRFLDNGTVPALRHVEM